jgi:hypothetical protein
VQTVQRDRKYEWDAELDDGDETPCKVVARVSGSDWAGDHLNPPEYREVEISVYTTFCPSTPDECKGCERVDVTEKCSEEFIERMWEFAIMTEDDQQAADREAADEARYDVNHDTSRSMTEWEPPKEV